MKEYQNRIQSFVEVKNRTMHLGNTKYVYDPSIGKIPIELYWTLMEIILLIMPTIL